MSKIQKLNLLVNSIGEIGENRSLIQGGGGVTLCFVNPNTIKFEECSPPRMWDVLHFHTFSPDLTAGIMYHSHLQAGHYNHARGPTYMR